MKFNYTTIIILDNLVLHYSNNNIYGYLYNNISLEIIKWSLFADYKLNDNLKLSLIISNYGAYETLQEEKFFLQMHLIQNK